MTDSGPAALTTDSTPTFASCASPFTTPPLDSGPHSFVVRAIDASGNVDPSPALGFTSGVSQVLQSRRRAKGITDLLLKGGAFRSCRARAGDGSAVAAGLSRRTIRRLRSSARGRFRTGGRNSSATVRGTIWEVIDRCDGTLTKVRRGKVAVRDFRLRRTVLVRAGKSYLAGARR